jgi:hypothetical protein
MLSRQARRPAAREASKSGRLFKLSQRESVMARRKTERTRLRRGHVALGPVADPELAGSSCALDAAEDARWFRAHPGLRERLRPPSPLERAAFALPPGARVAVLRLSDGSQARAFLLPDPPPAGGGAAGPGAG